MMIEKFEPQASQVTAYGYGLSGVAPERDP